MKTYQVTLPDETAAMVEKMMQDGPWETVDQLFADGVGTLQEDVLVEAEMGLDYEEIRRKLREAQDSLDRGESHTEEEVWSFLMKRMDERRVAAKS